MINLSSVPTKFFCCLLSPVILYEGRIFLKPLSRVNNLETQIFLRTLTFSRVAGDCDFIEGQGLSWTWTDPNSPFRTILIFLNFHGPLLQQVSFVLVSCGTGRREAGIRIMKESNSIIHLQFKPNLCQAPALTAGQLQLCNSPILGKTGRLQTCSKYVTSVWASFQCLTERNKDTLLPPSLLEMEVTPSPSLSPPQEMTTFRNPGNDRLQNVDSAHFAKYLNLHISIIAFLLSGEDSDSPDQSIHKGEENFLLAL